MEKIAEAKCWGGKKKDACTKEFASKILFLASAVSMVLYFSGSGLWVLPCAALIVFSAMEWGCPAVLTASGTSISRRRCDKGMGLGTYSPYYDRELTLLRPARL